MVGPGLGLLKDTKVSKLWALAFLMVPTGQLVIDGGRTKPVPGEICRSRREKSQHIYFLKPVIGKRGKCHFRAPWRQKHGPLLKSLQGIFCLLKRNQAFSCLQESSNRAGCQRQSKLGTLRHRLDEHPLGVIKGMPALGGRLDGMTSGLPSSSEMPGF